MYGPDLEKQTSEWKTKHENADEIVFHKDGTVMAAIYVSPCGKRHKYLQSLFAAVRKEMYGRVIDDGGGER